MNTTLYTCLRARDARALIAFLESIGFERAIVVDGPGGVIEHSQLRWGAAGGVMIGSLRGDDSPLDRAAGHAAAYLVVPSDADVDAWFERALAAGGTARERPTGQDYGGRSAAILDPEGNLWSCGSYAGESAG